MSNWGGGLILPFGDSVPVVADDVFIAHGATVIGDVEVGGGCSLWYGVTLRGDVNKIRVGSGTNIQDGTVVHVTRRTHGTFIGSGCTIGHGCQRRSKIGPKGGVKLVHFL